MMTLREFFDRDIGRPINGVVKADQQDDASMWQELDEFVVTSELDKHLHSFFRSYLEVADHLNKPEIANKVGAWISGFFGSGKSHYLKVLSYLMGNRELRYDGQTKRTVDFFETKISDPLFYADIKRAVAFPTDIVLFNIETKADHASGRDAILAVLLRMLNELQGYAGHPPHIAHMERHLAERGKLDVFKKAFQESSGKEWIAERDAFDFYRDDVIRALSSALGQSEEAATKWFDNAESNFSLTVENFCKWVKEYLDSKGPDHRLLFFADEVGAFVGQNSQLMLNLQTITETLGTTSGGRAWIIVTSQEDIDAVIGEMNQSRANDFSRITARFKTRMSLSSANVDEVLRARLLAKREPATKLLKTLFAEKGDTIRNQLTFGQTGMTMRSYKDAEDFAATYPFIPYQFQLVQKIFEASRKVGATGMHLARGERSLLDAFQSASIQIQDCPPGVLVPLYRFYPSIENFLDTSVKLTIETAAQNASLEPFDISILQVLFLIRYVDEVKGSVDNLVALCLDEIDADRLALRRRIEASLLRLEGQTLISRNGDDFAFLTNEERDLSREIKGTELDPGAEAKFLGTLIFDHVLKEQRKHRYSVNGKDFTFNRTCDKHPHGNRVENAVGVHVVTPLNEDYTLYDASRCTLESTTDGGQLLIRLADQNTLGREARAYLQTERFISRKSDGSLNTSAQRILRDFADENRQRLQRLVASMGDLITHASFYAGGQAIQPKAAAPALALSEGLEYLIRNTFTKMGHLKHLLSEPLKEIQAVLRTDDIGQQTLAIQTEEGSPQAIQELRDYLRLCTQTSKAIVLHDLVEDRFSSRPYGWPSLETILLVARLAVIGEINLVRAGAKIPIERAFDELSSTGKWRQITLVQRKTTDPAEIQKARKLGQELFGDMGPDNEDQLAAHIQTKLKDWLGSLQQFKALADTGEYPGKDTIHEGITHIQRLLAESESFKFLERFIAQKDDLLDLSDRFHELSHFYKKQRPLWDDLRKSMERFRLNQLQLERDASASAALQRMEQILKAPSPYKMLPEVRGHIDAVQAINESLVSASRSKALATIDETFRQIEVELQQMGAGVPQLGDALKQMGTGVPQIGDALKQLDSSTAQISEIMKPFDSSMPHIGDMMKQLGQLRLSASAQASLAHLDQAANESARLFESTVSAIEEYTRTPVTYEPKGRKPMEKPAVKPRRVIEIQRLIQKPFLENEAEVEDFLSKLRTELHDAIAKNERIQIK